MKKSTIAILAAVTAFVVVWSLVPAVNDFMWAALNVVLGVGIAVALIVTLVVAGFQGVRDGIQGNEADQKMTAKGRAHAYGMSKEDYQIEVAQRKMRGERTINLNGK